MTDYLFGMNRGASPNRIEDALGAKRVMFSDLRAVYTAEIYQVVSYDHIANTVSVVPQTDPTAVEILNVPVVGMGGTGWRFYHALRGEPDPTKANASEPDLGLLVYPRTDSTMALGQYRRRHPPTGKLFAPVGAVFYPGLPVLDPTVQTIPANVVASDPAAHEIGPETIAMVDRDGAGIILNTIGGVKKMVIRTDELFLLKMDQVEADALKVGLDGDGAGTNLSASGFVKAGPA